MDNEQRQINLPTETFIRLIESVANIYNRKLDSGVIMGYWVALHDIAEDELTEGVRRSICDCQWMPVPATLRNYALQYRMERRRPVIHYKPKQRMNQEKFRCYVRDFFPQHRFKDEQNASSYTQRRTDIADW